MKPLKGSAALLAVLALYAFASTSDLEAEREAERLYFENVCIYQIWPDYRGIEPCK